MKRTIRCLNCKNVIRRYGSYIVELEEEQIIGGIPTGQLIKKNGKLCRECYIKAGYKPVSKSEVK